MNRRECVRVLGAIACGLVIDPERLLWTPGAKTIFLPTVGYLSEGFVWDSELPGERGVFMIEGYYRCTSVGGSPKLHNFFAYRTSPKKEDVERVFSLSRGGPFPVPMVQPPQLVERLRRTRSGSGCVA